MNIKWLGHSCFLLTSENGTRILTDPFDDTVGYPLPDVEADIVTVSHDHFDHNHTAVVKNDFVLVNKAGEHLFKDIKIKGVSTFHDNANGAERGINIIFNISVDGINVCHCGDIGHTLTQQHAHEIGRVDVLLLPVGGVFTVDADGAYEIMRVLKPKVTIPMHFKTPEVTLPIDPVDNFIEKIGMGEHVDSNTIEVSQDNLGENMRVLVLNYQ